MAAPVEESTNPAVFVSYSRKDEEFVTALCKTLAGVKIDVNRDLDDISPGEEWWLRIENLIRQSDVLLFVISPDAVESEVCTRELDVSKSLNKRIVPVLRRDVDTSLLPQTLSRLNFIIAREQDNFASATDSLIEAITTDISWLREHTRLSELTHRWEH